MRKLPSMLAVGVALVLDAAAQTASNVADVPADVDAYPIVLTPTRLKQSLQDVPASVTIITSDTLRRFAIRSVPEALRLVPGMEITQASGPDYRINYHGTSILVPRRMNVLIDGVSAYQPMFARVDWANLPIAIDDIDRIEVTRGPNSAAYGPNSLLAIVNIISKHPKDVERAYASVATGTNGVSSGTVRLGATVGGVAMRLTANHERDGGFDVLQRAAADHDSSRISRLNFRAQAPLGRDTTIDFNAGYVGGTKEVPGVDSGGVTFPDAKPADVYLSVTIGHSVSPTHEIQGRAYIWSDDINQTWRTCYPAAALLPEMFTLYRANPGYANAVLAGRTPSGGSAADDTLALAAANAIHQLGRSAAAPICGTADQSLRQRRVDIELQDTYVVSERIRFVAGAGLRRHHGSSATYLGASVSNDVWRLFGNLEYRALPELSFNFGAYSEHDELSGSSFSPRIAANYRISDFQAVRFVWSRGTRTPDVQEQRANWTYTFADAMPPLNGSSTARLYQSAQAPGGLASERIRSVEIGYLLNVPTVGLMLDIKAFDDSLTSLISEKLQLSSFRPTNSSSVRLSGIEFQANVSLSADWTMFANYAYLRNHGATNVLETTQYSRHSGSAGLWHALGNGWSGSLAYFGASGDGLGQAFYGRSDLTLSKSISVGSGKAELSLTARRLDNLQQTYFRDFGAANTLRAAYDSRWQFLGQLRVSF
jgi:iron complex outermembrane receptor protein